MGVTEVTQAQYQRVMGSNPSAFQGTKVEGDSANYPVEQTTWTDAVEFCSEVVRSTRGKSGWPRLSIAIRSGVGVRLSGWEHWWLTVLVITPHP